MLLLHWLLKESVLAALLMLNKWTNNTPQEKTKQKKNPQTTQYPENSSRICPLVPKKQEFLVCSSKSL